MLLAVLGFGVRRGRAPLKSEMMDWEACVEGAPLNLEEIESLAVEVGTGIRVGVGVLSSDGKKYSVG